MPAVKQKQKAFMEAYRPCHEALLKYCSALAYGKMETEDLVQDVLLATYTNWDKIRNKGQLLHYMIRAARNRAISLHRRSKFRGELLDKQAERLTAQGLSPEMALDIQLLYWALDQLPAKQKEAVILFEITGFSNKEIAEIQQSSLSAVKTRISRGRQQLKVIMDRKPTTYSIVGILATAKTILL